MAWEVKLFSKTRLGAYKNCLKLIKAYAEFAPLWERVLLAIFAGIGPPLARCFGRDTMGLWQHAEEIVEDLLATSNMSPREIAEALRHYVKLKRTEAHNLSFEQARANIYDRSFYPLVTHFTLAFQPSAVARMRFVRRAIASLASPQAILADLGCGSGAILCEVLKDRPGCVGYGLDISAAAIAYAKRLATHKGVANRVQFQTGCLTDLPFANHSLDVLIASEVVEHLPEPERVLKEFSRVLSSDGLMLITMPVESHTPAHKHTLSSAAELCDLIERAGLVVSSIEDKWHVSYGDDRNHIFAVARRQRAVEADANRLYSLPLPQISSAASSGMVSS